jgi:hypothetical protein
VDRHLPQQNSGTPSDATASQAKQLWGMVELGVGSSRAENLILVVEDMHRVCFPLSERGAVYRGKPNAGASEPSRPKSVYIALEAHSNPKERSVFPYSAPFRFVWRVALPFALG